MGWQTLQGNDSHTEKLQNTHKGWGGGSQGAEFLEKATHSIIIIGYFSKQEQA